MRLDAAGFKGHIAAVTDEVDLAETTHETVKRRPEIRWGIGVSVLLHVPIVALLIFGLPKIEPKPPEDESVKVELVPPPEEKKPEEKKPKEKPPEPKPPQEAKKAPPPPPPPPPPANKAAELQPEARKPLPAMRPVFEFGAKDTGPTKSSTGSSSQGEPNAAHVPPPSAPTPMQPEPAENVTEKLAPMRQPSGKLVPKDVNLPEVAAVDIHPERDAPVAATTEGAQPNFETDRPSETKTPTQREDEARREQLPQAKTLFSRSVADDPVARTAMGNMSRGQRMDELCRTELGQQLEHESPKYRGAGLPSYKFTNETVVEVRQRGRFVSGSGSWYRIQFRCEVNADATRVLAFFYKVGDLIPRSQYPKYNIDD
ncbi:DUF930 domain-containing protein [Rhizobium sp. NLR9b]|uniref:DUF930 domain-containing protein n=1 Tax=unclassified Rhizobium TaxID=2613769 RepID=UPI001C829DE6|nr:MULTISPECIES: DUF930 domain-containing protein [unclassified Rhizobium]MBX5230555.1 DUF930 domain-containing protein [Rhizobium sp. NLR9b]MBX5291223.1 DUF930 domain-containing protein [Rhizobium sp. NLR10b]